MVGAATIVIARDDLSIAGGAEPAPAAKRHERDTEKAFFELVRTAQPDVIVLDCRGDASRGVDAIQKIRRRIHTPVLIICSSGDRRQHDYRIAGAADCLEGPFDILQLNHSIQHIMRLNAGLAPRPMDQSGIYQVAGLIFEPLQNTLASPEATVRLTTAENRLLLYFVSRRFVICSRTEIANAVYGALAAQGDRAIDVLVTRLRKKFADLRGPNTPSVIRTEFRQGYTFVGDVNEPAMGELVWEASTAQ